jgi:hypothetical protein
LALTYRARIAPKGRIAAIAVVAALAPAGCGDDDEEAPPATSGTTGTPTPGQVSFYITAGEFTKAALPDQVAIVEDFVNANPVECQKANPDNVEPLLKPVSIQAAAAPPDTPLTGILLDECSGI